MSSSLFNPEPTMDDLIQSGRHCYAVQKYERALPFFTRCDNPYHILALDLRAASYGALGKLDDAMNDAEWILELAPRLSDGYLRLGKVAQLQKKDEYAWRVYTAGIEVNKEFVVGFSPGLQQLYYARKPLHRRFFRQDPLCLPSELVTRIFLHLNFTEILVLRSTPGVWAMKKILSWAGAGGARKIVIPRNMVMTLSGSGSTFVDLLTESPSLEYLEIGLLSQDIWFPPDDKRWNRLRHVSVQSQHRCFYEITVDHPQGFPQSFLQNAASSLENLEFVGIPKQWFSRPPLMPLLPKLPLSTAFPSLEQLWTGPNLPHLDSDPGEVGLERMETIWPHLKVFIFDSHGFSWGDFADLSENRTLSTLRELRCLNRGNSLQHVRFRVVKKRRPCISIDIRGILPELDDAQRFEYQYLHSFRSNLVCISPDGARTLLYNGIMTKQLSSFDIVFPQESTTAIDRAGDARCFNFRFPDNPKNDEDLPLPDFLASFPNLRTLEIYSAQYKNKSLETWISDFLMGWSRRPQDVPGNSIATSTFTNHSQDSEFVNVVVAIIRRTHLRTIYTTDVKGPALDQLRQAAREHDVELIDKLRSQQWPMPLSE
ncbi:uncharacterized protein CPUR_03486 [Claviceps purpurea 20.1]|uniref:Uncharacterized protein n=1 Tax=Claviceps purpurea (strain 20.1) TaxID=1111077 RepID=M1WDT2_CLAP2|nr:uncharacterized protein CPUR_03486 [Claviceps purpurea 20.1]